MTIENTIRIVKQVESTHKNLGLPTIFTKLVDLSNLGLFLIGDRSVGKGSILSAIEQIRHRKVIKMGRITPAGLAKMAKKLDNMELTFINPDITSLMTYYLRDAAINVFSHLISERGLPPSWTAQYQYEITNCIVSFLSGAQPKTMRTIQSLESWESMYKDRFLRFCLLHPLGEPRYIEKYPSVDNIYLPSDFMPQNVTITKEIRQSYGYIRMKTILERQTSAGRCGIYLDRLIRAHAYLNGRDIVLEVDLKILELMSVNLMIDEWLGTRKELSSPKKFNPNAYLLLFFLVCEGKASRKDMRRHFTVSDRTVVRSLRVLRAKNIVMGTYGRDEYKLNRTWYMKYILPVLKWHKQIGVM